jgi:hypothetical protein
MEIALQDFSEMSPHEREEMMFIGLLQLSAQTQWLQNTFSKLVDTLNKGLQ